MSEFLARLHELYADQNSQSEELDIVKRHNNLWPSPGQVWHLSVQTADGKTLAMEVEIILLHILTLQVNLYLIDLCQVNAHLKATAILCPDLEHQKNISQN